MNNVLLTQNLPAGASAGGAGQGKDPAEAATYLSDESRLPGKAEKIFFPRSEAEVVEILCAAGQKGKDVTFSGGRTGITGGAVPEGGWLVSDEKMNAVLGIRHDAARRAFFVRCQPGITLDALNKMLAEKHFENTDKWPEADRKALELFRQEGEWRFAPDPTESSATIGGMIACNASGARTFHYGPTRDYVSALRLALAGGAMLDIRRGECFADANGAFQLILPDGKKREGRIPDYKMPPVKNAAGYFAEPGMDLIDLFIGSEGTLGVITEAELALVRPPEVILGVIGFFGSEENALDFVRAARGENTGKAGQGCPTPALIADVKSALPEDSPLKGNMPALAKPPLAIEYFDHRALDLLRDQKKKVGPSSEIPALPETAHTAVYIELPTTEEGMEKQAEELLALLEACASSADTAWTALSPEETEKLKKFRHALPETINQRIGERAAASPGLTKLGTDFAVPDKYLADIFGLYRRTLDGSGLEYVIFGHIGNNHVHINILPKNMDEYKRGKEIYLQLAQAVVRWEGTVSGEHGIGKLKKAFLVLMYGEAGIGEMRAVKRVFDPEGRINPGNMFELK
jgi:D-lactate dehydrogenase (cytochrome)